MEIPEGRCDTIILASILHETDSRENLLKNVYRLLKTGGTILAVEWKKVQTPFGPEMSKRLTPEELAAEFNALGIRHEMEVPADSYHYASIFIK